MNLEEIKKEWEALGYDWLENDKAIHIEDFHTFIVLNKVNQTYKVRNFYDGSAFVSMQLHKMLTKTFKVLGWL